MAIAKETQESSFQSQPRRSRFFVLFSVVVALLVFAGFTRTFFVPLALGRFSRPWFVYVHGLLFFSWIVLFVIQAVLAVRRQMRWHRRLGWWTASLIPLMVVSGLAVAFWATRRDVALGQGAEALPFFFGQIMDMFLFGSLAAAAVMTRRRPSIHKRLVLLATLAVLGAAVGRIRGLGISANFITLGLVCALVAFDLISQKRLHWVTVIGSAYLLVGIFTEDSLGNTAPWLAIANQIVRGH